MPKFGDDEQKKPYIVDMMPMITYLDEWLMPNHTLCRCKFNDFMVYCYEEAESVLRKHYGETFMIPDGERKSQWMLRVN